MERKALGLPEDKETPGQALRREWMEQGVKQGVKKGKEQSAKAIAANMLGMGLPVGTVSQATGLTEDEVRGLGNP